MAQKKDTRQVIMITDGKPSALTFILLGFLRKKTRRAG